MMDMMMRHHPLPHTRIMDHNIWDGFFDDITDEPCSMDSSHYTSTTDDLSYSNQCPSSPSDPASPASSNYSDAENVQNSPGSVGNCGKIRSPVKRVQQRYAANMRERKRMKSINDAFEGLRTRIPLVRGDKKLSKVDTLRSAIDYIHELSQLLQSCSSGQFGANYTEKKKVIVRCQSPDMYEDYDIVPLYGHSLSWVNDDEPQYGPNNTLVAKIWMPEDPRGTEIFE